MIRLSIDAFARQIRLVQSCLLMLLSVVLFVPAEVSASLRIVPLKKKGFSPIQVAVAECKSQTTHQPRKNAPRLRPEFMVVLHGRGGSTSVGSLLESFRPSLCKHNLKGIAPAAPTANANWPFETPSGEGQDQFLLDLIQKDARELLKLSPKKAVGSVLVVGVSAGATFLMGDFYPKHGHQLRGTAIALCGGSWPVNGVIQGVKTIEANFPLFVQIGKTDFLFDQVRAGLTKYSELGLPVRARFTDRSGHCAFDFNEAIDNVLAEAQ